MMEYTVQNEKGYVFDVVKAKNGEPTLKVVISAEKHVFRHSSYNPSQEAQRWIETFHIPEKETIVLMGLGLGYELAALLPHINRDQRVYVIEKSREIFSCFRKIQANNAILNKSNITFIINTAPQDIQAIFKNLPSSSLCLLRHPSTRSLFSHYYSEIESLVHNYKKETMTAIVLVGRGIVAPFIVEDIACALTELGCTVKLLPLRRQGEDLLRRAQEIKPDCIIALDNNGLDFPWVKKLSCRKIAWFVDNPFYFLDNTDKETLLFCWDEDYIPELRQAGFQNIFFLPLATNPSIFNTQPLSSSDSKKYTCDVSFVGSIGKPREALYEERNRLLNQVCNAEINMLFDTLMQKRMARLLSGESGHLRDLLGSQFDTIDVQTRLCIDRQSDFETGSLLRERVVSVLRSFDGLLFGNKELARMESETCRFVGSINYRTELPKLYKTCLVNVNVTRPQLLSTVNQRIYDISATHSFFLTDHRRFLKTIFPFDSNAICFRSLKELADKIRYYVRNKREREHIAQEMFNSVIMKHTYKHRMYEMIHVIKKFL